MVAAEAETSVAAEADGIAPADDRGAAAKEIVHPRTGAYLQVFGPAVRHRDAAYHSSAQAPPESKQELD